MVYELNPIGSAKRYDAILVGAGIMSATLAVMLKELDPDLKLLIVERLARPGLESSAAENNAGTGHAANCELNYTPLDETGEIRSEKALTINLAFERSLEFWSSLTERGKLDPKQFLNQLPHISFVWGDDDIEFLRKRYECFHSLKPFESIEWSESNEELRDWIPLVIEGRNLKQKVAATKIERGTDIDFGSLISEYLDPLIKDSSIEIKFNSEVVSIEQDRNYLWHLGINSREGSSCLEAPFVFLGAGGGTLSLLQKTRIPEASIYGGFPVSGQWLVCRDGNLIDRHHAKVYGKPQLGAPPMSVPHLDTRWIEGRRSLLFGPFAGFSSKFLKKGSFLDLFESITFNNFKPMIDVGLTNVSLVNYLIKQIMQNEEDRFDSLRTFLPNANIEDWELAIAGQRVQIIKKTVKGGTLRMGTELVTSSDNSLAALLGASPGASTAVSIMLEVLKKCWISKDESGRLKSQLSKLLPSYKGNDSEKDFSLLLSMRQRSDSLLGLR